MPTAAAMINRNILFLDIKNRPDPIEDESGFLNKRKVIAGCTTGSIYPWCP
jgi:hypothetical protein